MTRTRQIAVALGAVCILLLTYLNSRTYDILSLGPYAAHIQFGLLVGGAGLLIWGFSRSEKAPAHIVAREGGWLVAIILLAFALRVWNLEYFVHFYVDEGNFVEGILKLWQTQDVRLLAPFGFIAAFTWVYPFMQAGAVSIFGPNLVSLRIISAVFGTMTIAAVYRLGRLLFTRRIALLAAFLLAVFPAHIHFSRLGLNNIADPLFGVLALIFLTRAMQRRRLGDYALAGVMLGLTQYFYEGGRLLYPPLILLWVMLAGFRWRPWLGGLLLMLATALLIGGPVYYTLSVWGISLTTRLNRGGFDPGYYALLLLSTAQEGYLWGHLREQILPPFLHYLTLPDLSEFFYGGSTALILPHLVPVFLGGIVIGLRRYARPAGLLLLWITLTALGNSLIRHNTWTPRYVVSFPAVALLLALGLYGLIRWLQKRPRAALLVPLLIAVVGLSQVWYYFGPHQEVFQRQVRSEHDQQDLLFRLKDLPPNTKAYLITDDNDLWMPLLIFLSQYWGMDDFQLYVRLPTRLEDWDVLNDPWWGQNHAFFVEQEDKKTQDYLRSRFNIGPDRYSPYNVPLEKQYLLLYYEPTPPAGEAQPGK